MFGRKKNNNQAEINKNRDLIENTAKSMDTLIMLSKADKELADKLKELQNQIKYFIPSGDKKVQKIDDHINDLLEDLRKTLLKENYNDYASDLHNILRNLEIAITDRKANI